MRPNLIQNSMDFEIENRKKIIKKGFKTWPFFYMDFSLILNAFWKVLGRSWGGFGEHFGVQKGSQKSKITFLNENVIFKSWREGLGRVLGGFGEGFGRVLEGSGNLLGALGISRRPLNHFLSVGRCLVAFLLFFLLLSVNHCLFRLCFAFAAFCLC